MQFAATCSCFPTNFRDGFWYSFALEKKSIRRMWSMERSTSDVLCEALCRAVDVCAR